MFCMIKPDRPPYCDFMQIGVFWKCATTDRTLKGKPRSRPLAGTGSSAVSSSSGSASCARSARATGPTSARSSSTRAGSARSRSRRKRPTSGRANTSSSTAPRSRIGSGTRSRSPRPRKRTTSRSTFAASATSPPSSPKRLDATSPGPRRSSSASRPVRLLPRRTACRARRRWCNRRRTGSCRGS